MWNYDFTEVDKIHKYLNIKEPKVMTNGNSCKDLKVVITGKLNTFKNRNEFKEKIEACGGKVVDSVNNTTSILINNDVNSTSGKNQTAKKLNIPILSEEEFILKYLNF